MKLFRILDPFTATLVTVVLLASFFPARGAFVPFFEHLTTAAIALLFFMHGAKLSREAIIFILVTFSVLLHKFMA